MSAAAFEPKIPTSERPKTRALVRGVKGIDYAGSKYNKNFTNFYQGLQI